MAKKKATKKTKKKVAPRTKKTAGSTSKKKAKRKTAARPRRTNAKMAISGAAKSLDPRLRRLVHTMYDAASLKLETALAFVASTEVAAAEAATDEGRTPSVESCYKRVLIKIRGSQAPPELQQFESTQIVPGVFSVNVPIGQLPALSESSSIEFIDGGQEFAPLLSTSLPETRADEVHNPTSGAAFDGTGVVVGFIDFGFDFTLDDFRNADGTTRIAFFWDQTLTPVGNENHPNGFTHGVEYAAADIDNALNATSPFNVVRHSVTAEAHGTHVAGIAAGNGRSADAAFPAGDFVGAAPNATLILVQPASNDQATTFTDSAHVAEAVRYIVDRADDLSLPCVINMSLGQNGGSHDGESVVERAIDQILEEPGRAFVVAGGNEHVWRTHASGQLTATTGRTLDWRVGATAVEAQLGPTVPLGIGDRTRNEMEIWYSSHDRFRVRVEDPNGNQTVWFEPGEADTVTLGTDRVFVDSERFTILNGESRIYIDVRPLANLVDPGVWHVRLEALEVHDGRFDAWIERDARDRDNRFRDQSFFLGMDFDPVKTLGTPGTGKRSIVVANYSHVTQTPSDSSGRGPTRDDRHKPDIAAPGTGILSSNSRGGTTDAQGNTRPMRVPKSGTSMAAPHVAGIAALMLQADRSLTSEQIRKMLIASARPPAGVTGFDPAWGYGRVDARAAVDLII